MDLAESVGRRLRRSGLAAHTVRLKLRYGDYTTRLRQTKVDPPTDDDLAVYRAARLMFAAAWDGRPVRLLGVGVSGLEAASKPAPGLLFAATAGKAKRLNRAVDAIKDRFGDDAIRHGRP
jgi:DNA polymerase-4